jgi:CRISPR-associated protein Cas2
MRIIVFFDLPTTSKEDLRNYRKFRKRLINKGFVMMQESVYCRMVLNNSIANTLIISLRKNKPPEGLVQILIVTEKQFSNVEYLIGEKQSDLIDSDESVIIL